MRLKRGAAAIFLPLPNMGSRTQLPNKQWYATAPVHKFEKYCPKIVESDWYDWWLKRGLFKPTSTSTATKGASTKDFSMLLPPPNVTGVLHIGHALTLSIQDAIARWNRMHGLSVNWVPGTDHAGISMQSVVEKKLLRESGLSRHDLGRQAFIDKVWQWKREHGETIKMQTRSIGASVDWSQEYFTMDEGHSRVITPAHDENDYACAQRHALQIVPVFQSDGTVINDSLFGEFVGKSRWDARRMIIDTLSESKAYMGKRDAEASVISRCSRSGDIIEPMLKPQWYVRCSSMAQRADEMVQTGNIDLIPERQRVIWHNWLAGIEDWCVSRQLWWGHRIPLYRIEWVDGNRPGVWVAAKSEQHARQEALMSLPSSTDTVGAAGIRSVVQDDDVLDTWFSSGLLPLTVFGPARGTRALSSVLETGQDILFFWVARMAMLCTYFAQMPPFSTVLLHPMVRDSQGRKMSKSLGNIIDPMDVIHGAELSKLQETLQRGYLTKKELAQSTKELKRLYPSGFQRFGADALRFTLLVYTQQTQQINMSLDNVKASYHFCNKIWNTFRFVHMHANKLGVQKTGGLWFDDIDQMSIFDRALVSKLCGMLSSYQQAMGTYRLAVAAELVRDFVQRDLCDRYIELCKLALFGNQGATNQDPVVAVKILLGSFEIVLRALHPFMPFLTEELWQQQERVGAKDDMSIMESVWEQPAGTHNGVLKLNLQSELVLGIVSAIRSLKQQHVGRLDTAQHPDSEPIFSVVVAVGVEDASEGRSAAEQAIQTATQYKECVEIMSRETGILIRTDAGSDPDSDPVFSDSANKDEKNNVATIVVSPQVRVVARLSSDKKSGLDQKGKSVDKAGSTVAAVGKLKAELESVYRIVNSAGYQKNAPLNVKESDR
ncbi:hypothetical protein LPJ66_001297 [Kickxella alabastrina]|uniref:Uncharacterized protein n=1 Tax=Kickxella alabastrina TaxID=61397 RepID=A0ACC1ITM2_9FUNG|nr:hypothetical protein LPJ66_001297 [Kickxella alabastrina]